MGVFWGEFNLKVGFSLGIPYFFVVVFSHQILCFHILFFYTYYMMKCPLTHWYVSWKFYKIYKSWRQGEKLVRKYTNRWHKRGSKWRYNVEINVTCYKVKQTCSFFHWGGGGSPFWNCQVKKWYSEIGLSATWLYGDGESSSSDIYCM